MGKCCSKNKNKQNERQDQYEVKDDKADEQMLRTQKRLEKVKEQLDQYKLEMKQKQDQKDDYDKKLQDSKKNEKLDQDGLCQNSVLNVQILNLQNQPQDSQLFLHLKIEEQHQAGKPNNWSEKFEFKITKISDLFMLVKIVESQEIMGIAIVPLQDVMNEYDKELNLQLIDKDQQILDVVLSLKLTFIASYVQYYEELIKRLEQEI